MARHRGKEVRRDIWDAGRLEVTVGHPAFVGGLQHREEPWIVHAQQRIEPVVHRLDHLRAGRRARRGDDLAPHRQLVGGLGHPAPHAGRDVVAHVVGPDDHRHGQDHIKPSISSIGRASATRPCRPAVVVARNKLSSTASSVASTAASNRPFRSRSDSTSMVDSATTVASEATTGAEGEEDLAAAVGGHRTRSRQTESGTAGESLALRRQDRCIGRDDDDATSLGCLAFAASTEFGEPTSDRRAVDAQPLERAEVRQHQDTEHVPSTSRDEVPMPPFQPRQVIPDPAPIAPASEQTVGGVGQSVPDVVRLHRHRRRVAEPRVVALTDHRE